MGFMPNRKSSFHKIHQIKMKRYSQSLEGFRRPVAKQSQEIQFSKRRMSNSMGNIRKSKSRDGEEIRQPGEPIIRRMSKFAPSEE